jgi:hypothetical protein
MMAESEKLAEGDASNHFSLDVSCSSSCSSHHHFLPEFPRKQDKLESWRRWAQIWWQVDLSNTKVVCGAPFRAPLQGQCSILKLLGIQPADAPCRIPSETSSQSQRIALAKVTFSSNGPAQNQRSIDGVPQTPNHLP